MKGGAFPKFGSRLSAARIRFKKSATASRMEGGSPPKFGSRLGAAHIRLKSLQQIQGWMAIAFQNAALGRLLFKGARSGVKRRLV